MELMTNPPMPNTSSNLNSLRSSLDHDAFLGQPCDVIIHDDVPEALEGSRSSCGKILQGRSRHRVSDFASFLTTVDQNSDVYTGSLRQAEQFRERLLVRLQHLIRPIA
jgi:hypothetical protein